MIAVELAWLAGILEGEGCFSYQGTPWIRLQMTDRDIVERAAALMETHCHPLKIRHHYKQAFRANVCGDRAIETMRLILPYMGLRRTAKIKEVFAKVAARPGMHYGERSGSSRLTDAQAEEIRRSFVRYKKGKGPESGVGKPNSGLALAKKYGVSQAAIWYAVSKRRNSDGTQPLRPP